MQRGPDDDVGRDDDWSSRMSIKPESEPEADGEVQKAASFPLSSLSLVPSPDWSRFWRLRLRPRSRLWTGAMHFHS